MTAHPYFLLAGAMALAISALFLWRAARRSFDGEADWIEEEDSAAHEWDSLSLQLSAVIFNPEDSDFVAAETSPRLARRFRDERAALARKWIGQVRRQVSRLMRSHRRVAGGNPDLKPADELKLAVEFLFFQVTSGILYFVIWVHGPLHAAKLVGYSMKFLEELQEVTQDKLPAARAVAVEILRAEPQGKNRTATP